ncbi:11984_t:CDS:10, partial [Ambispora gerdemannii]
MSKVDTYFDDLTSCSLFGFLEHKHDTTKPERRTLAQACLNVFEVKWGNCLSAGVDFTLPPNLCVVELRPPCREQTNSVPVEQYWMDLAKYKLENEIYLEESILVSTCSGRDKGYTRTRSFATKTITKRFEKRSVSEVEEKSDDDFMPIRQPKRKKNLSLPKNKESVGSAVSKKAKTTKDTPSSSQGVPNPSSSPGVPNLSSSPGVPNLSSSPGITNPSSSKSVGSTRGDTKMMDEVNNPGYNRPHTPPHQIYSTSENQNLLTRLRNEKQRAKSTMEPICSNIVDTTNKNLMERLQYQYDHRWEPVINDATKYIDELIENSDTRNDLRNKLLLPFIPSGETYSFSKYYEVHWVHRFADKLSLFFEAPRNPLLDKNSEGAETYVDEDPQKPISYKHKLFREMKDQLDRLLKKLEFTKESIKEVKKHLHTWNVAWRYRIGTTWLSVPDILMTLKKILCLK